MKMEISVSEALDRRFSSMDIDVDKVACEFVCHDEGQSEWRFNPEDNFYYRFRKTGEWYRRISLKNMQNPHEIWEARCHANPDIPPWRFRPAPSVFDLWKDKCQRLAK